MIVARDGWRLVEEFLALGESQGVNIRHCLGEFAPNGELTRGERRTQRRSQQRQGVVGRSLPHENLSLELRKAQIPICIGRRENLERGIDVAPRAAKIASLELTPNLPACAIRETPVRSSPD